MKGIWKPRLDQQLALLCEDNRTLISKVGN